MLETKDLIDLTHTLAAPILEDKKYPWEALPLIKEFILQLGPTLDPEVYENKGEGIWIAKSAKVLIAGKAYTASSGSTSSDKSSTGGAAPPLHPIVIRALQV